MARLARRALLLAALASGVVVLRPYLSPGVLAGQLDRVAAAVGLGIGQVSVEGFEHTLPEDILAALGTAGAGSLLTYDTLAAERRLEALPWVEKAAVARVLPDAVEVTLKERRPFAVWQHRQMLFVVDRAGRPLEPVAPGDYRELPLAVGEGAAEHLGDLLGLLAGQPDIAGRTSALVRVGDRRWTLKLRDGAEILLPEDGAEAALARLAELQRDFRVLDRDLAALDLRLPGRVVARPAIRALGADGQGRTAAGRLPASTGKGV